MGPSEQRNITGELSVMWRVAALEFDMSEGAGSEESSKVVAVLGAQ